MRREGSALAGVGVVTMKELADNLASWRMRLLEALIFLTGAWAVYTTIGAVKEVVGESSIVFLILFTSAQEGFLSFLSFLGILIPIIAIALGFDSVNSEFNQRTMSRLLAQPIYRDALLFGKFLAGLSTIAITLTALWLFVIGLGILFLGLPPNTEEVLRALAFLLASIAYGGVWLALAMLFSVIFRSAATAALAALAAWLLFAFFWMMLARQVADAVAPLDPYRLLDSALTHEALFNSLARISPNFVYTEVTQAFLNPGLRTFSIGGELALRQGGGAIPNAPLPFMESLALVWPQLTGMLAGFIVLFTIAYALFQRQEVRA